MVKIAFILADGTRREVEGEVGESVKDAALLSSLPGIAGKCGGVCASATCHVVVDPEWLQIVGAPPDFEDGMLMIAGMTLPSSSVSLDVVTMLPS